MNSHWARSERAASAVGLPARILAPAPRNRTWDLPLTGRLLCRLSYAGAMMAHVLVGEPETTSPEHAQKSQIGRGAASSWRGSERSNRGSRNKRGAAGQIWTFTMSNSAARCRRSGCGSRMCRDRWARVHGRAHPGKFARGRNARRHPRGRSRVFNRTVLGLAEVLRAISVPPACRRRVWARRRLFRLYRPCPGRILR